MAEAATRERLRLAAVAAGITLVALVGIISVIWVPAPTELTYTLVSDEDGNVGVQSLSQAAVEPAVQPLDGSYRLVNKCNLYGCRTIRVRVGESRKLEAEHEARLQAMKLEQDSKLKAQRNAMEVALRERQAATYSPAYLTTAMHKPQELAAAPHAQKAAAAIAHAFAKVDSENPQHKAGASQLVVKKQDKAAEAAKDKVARKPKDSLQAEAKQAMADSAAVKTRVEQEVAAIKVAAEAAEGKIKKEEHAEVKELKAADHRQQVHAAPVVAPPTATFKKAALPLQDGPKAAKFSEPVPSSAHSTAVKVAKPTAAAATPHKMVTKAEDKHVQQAAVQSKPVKRLHRADHAARAPKVANMMDGDQKPRAEAPAAVEAGYWKQSAPAAVSTPGGRNPGAAWGRKQHRSLSAAKGADLKLSQLPPKNGGYGSRRAEGRAVMRAPGPAVEPDFADRKVVVDRPPRQALAKTNARNGHVLHLPGWFSSQMEKAMGIGSSDDQVKGDSPQAQRSLWDKFTGADQQLAGGVPAQGQQLAAHAKTRDAGKLKMMAVDEPALQKGMRNGGFGDKRVRASAPAEPLWDALGLRAKAGKL